MNLSKYYNIIYSDKKELSLSELYHYIQKDGYKISLDESFNIFVKNKEKKSSILVVAHLDRVLTTPPRLFRYEDCPKRLYGAYGWDDRAGIIAALELFQKYDIDLLFTTGEENGCIGAEAISDDRIQQYNLIFELDRHGSHDFINDCSMGLLCNDLFCNDICYYVGTKGKVLKPTRGVYTDVGALRAKNKTAQMFYMSCGYYNEHTKDEYLIPSELESAIETAGLIIEYVQTNPKVLYPFTKPERTKATKPVTSRTAECYCYGCDTYLLDEELKDGCCPFCGEPIEVFDEEDNYDKID